MSSSSMVVAAFDVDGTLTRSDCVRPFLERVGGRRGIVGAALRRAPATIVGLARRDRDRLKEIVVGGVLRGRRVDEVAAEGAAFAKVVEAEMLRHDTVGRLRWHQQMGHRTVLVSASLRPYLDPLAAALGLDGVVCTDVATDGGRYLGALDGGNCRAAEKAVRLQRWLGEAGIEDVELWAYGDSRGDREMLGMAHHPTWVRGTTLTAVPEETAR